jgi:hypothetical protein
MNNTCQNTECSNIGRKVRTLIIVNGQEQEHEIFLCQVCINMVNNMNGGLKN